MAKKQTAKAETIEKVEVPVVAKAPTKPKWEIKDRAYYLRDMSPLSYHLKSSGLYWFDEEAGYEREIAYSKNQRTVFVDEMKGQIRRGHVWFRNGALVVPKNEVTLQKFLSIYHPGLNTTYVESKPEINAANQVDYIELELAALNLAKSLSVEEAEAIMRVEVGSNVSTMSSSELKRDLLLFAKRSPVTFLDVAQDENIHLRNTGIKAVEDGILKLSEDQRTFTWASTGRKIMTVPFDEHPYNALAHWFKTDEGMEVFKNVEKRLNS